MSDGESDDETMSDDASFEALRARYTSLRGSIESQLGVPQRESTCAPPSLLHGGDERYLRERVMGGTSARPYPSVESAIDGHMGAQFAALSTSISTRPDAPAADAEWATVGVINTRPTGDALGALPPAGASTGSQTVQLHAARPSCGGAPTLMTASDVALASSSYRHMVPRCSNSQSATAAPLRADAPVVSYDESLREQNRLVFGHEAVRAALASHWRAYADSRAALRPARKFNAPEPEPRPTSARSASHPSLGAKRGTSTTRALQQQVRALSAKTQPKATRTGGARAATRAVPLARPASAGTPARDAPMASPRQAGRLSPGGVPSVVGDPRQAQVLALMKQRSEVIYQNTVAGVS